MHPRRALLGALATPLAIALATASAGWCAEAGGAASDLLAAYNQRDIGSPGMRRIRLELRDQGKLTRRFDIAHAWQHDGGAIRSLVLLEEPVNLRGTDYLLVEGSGTPTGLEVFLHLPAGRRQVLTIVPARFDEGLLGSDFGYTDLLWRVPLTGRRVLPLGAREIDGVPVRGFEVAPASEEARASTSWDRARYWLREEPALLLAAEYYRDEPGRPPAAEPAKRLRVEGWEARGGVWTPTRMVMDAGGGRTSTLTLEETRFGVAPLAPDLFRPAALPGLADVLRRGDTPEFLAELAR